MVMGLAAVIALPGPRFHASSQPAGQARRGIPLEQVPGSFGRAFRQRGLQQGARDARIIYVIRPIFSGEMSIEDRAISRLEILRAANCPKELIQRLTREPKVERSSGVDGTSARIASA